MPRLIGLSCAGIMLVSMVPGLVTGCTVVTSAAPHAVAVERPAVWVPGHWRHHIAGWAWIPGHWS
jgi:hypothetical protein